MDFSSVNSIVQSGVKQLVKFIGNEAMVVGKDWLEDRWNRLFSSKNIMILGPKESGKSSLILYLLNGQPYRKENGKKQTPDPTASTAIVNEKFKIQHGNWQQLKKDVPGDADLRSTWIKALQDVNPRGIIYMLDGRKSEDELLDETEDIKSSVMSYYDSSLKNLTTFHVFLNFADEWATNPEKIRTKTNLVRKILEKHVLDKPHYQKLRAEVSPTHLSPDESSWDETTRALYKFGADLVD